MVKGGAEFKQTWKYLYDDDGQLESASIVDNTQWRFSYDIRGNLISLVTRGIGSGRATTHKLNFEYDGNGLFKGKVGGLKTKTNFKSAFYQVDTYLIHSTSVHTIGGVKLMILDPRLFQSCLSFPNLTSQLVL